MIKGMESLTLFSESAKNLAAFYRDIVGIKIGLEAEMGEKGEELYELKLGKGPNLYVIDHSKVKGKKTNQDRIIFNLEEDDIKKEVARLKKQKSNKFRTLITLKVTAGF